MEADQSSVMMTCAQWVRYEPWKAFALAMLGAFTGLYVASFTWQYERARPPDNPTIIDPPSVHVVENGTRIITVHYQVNHDGACVRQGSYSLRRAARSSIDGIQRYHPLGSYINGAGFDGRMPQYKVEFDVPQGIEPGPWEFLLRIHYTCPPMMLIHWDWIAPVVTINLP